MPYPPPPGQPPHGQQPEQGGYPSSGSFPQQGGQYGGLGYYPQQGQYPGDYPAQYGYPQPGQYPGDYGGQYGYPTGGYPPGHGPEPPKKQTGLWLGIAAAIVVTALGVFAITAFVAPAFLLDDDDDADDRDNNAGGNSQHDDPDGRHSNEPEELIGQLITGVENDDSASLNQLACADAGQNLQEAIGSTDQVDQMQVTGEIEQLGDRIYVPVTTVESGTEHPGGVELTHKNGGWCWSDLGQLPEGIGDTDGGLGDDDSSGGLGDDEDDYEDDYDFEEAATLTEEFVDAINDGDQTAAEDMLCSDPAVLTEDKVEDATEDSADIAIDPGSVETYSFGDYDAELIGSVDDKEIDGYTILEAIVKDSEDSEDSESSEDSEDEFCINDFYY